MRHLEPLDACERCSQMHGVGDPCPAPARLGEVLADKYRVVRLIGQGGMGAVYEAQHTTVGRRFAVKFLHPELSRRPDLVERFRREALTVGSLESENIVSVVDFGQAPGGLPYLVMELLAGEDLCSFLAREAPLPVPRACDLIVQVCRALEIVHAAGIVHRDLKPANLFLSTRADGLDLVKVLDFGIVKLGVTDAGAPPSSITHPGAMIGTPFYMPPEQARGEQELDHRADIYALGVILFEALTGAKPHPGGDYNAILYHILMRPPTPLASLRPGLPGLLTEVVHRALASQPGDRQASVAELARELDPFRRRPGQPSPSSFAARASTELTPTGPIEAPAPPRASRSRHGIWMSLALLLCALGAGAAVVMGTGGARRGAGDPLNRAPGAPASAGTSSPPSGLTGGPGSSGGAPPSPSPAAAAAASVIAAPAPTTFAGQRPPAPARARNHSLPVAPGGPPGGPGPQPAKEPAAPRRPTFDRSNPYQ